MARREYPALPASFDVDAIRREGLPESSPFIPHEILARRARERPPAEPFPTVSAFTEWIYSLYVSQKSEEAIQRGKKFEASIQSLFREKRLDPLFPRKQARSDGCGSELSRLRNWEIEYEDPLDKRDQTFTISALRVSGKALVGRPDLVYRHRVTKSVLVVEHKSYWKLDEIPPFGWPNLKAQLWCYGKIDRWKDAPHVFLLGRIFDMGRYMADKTLSLRGHPEYRDCSIANYVFNTVAVCANDPRVSSECSELFALYGGRVSSE